MRVCVCKYVQNQYVHVYTYIMLTLWVVVVGCDVYTLPLEQLAQKRNKMAQSVLMTV